MPRRASKVRKTAGSTNRDREQEAKKEKTGEDNDTPRLVDFNIGTAAERPFLAYSDLEASSINRAQMCLVLDPV
jgi:hypothetical protein